MYGAPVGTIILSGGTNVSGPLISSNNSTSGGISALPTRVFHISIIGNATATTILNLTNGTSALSYTEIIVSGTTGRSTEYDFGFHGQLFQNGVYYTADANLVSASIACRADLT